MHEQTKLMKVTYYDPKNNIRLTGYSDTVVWDDKGQPTLMALRFGGYPEEVRGLADAILAELPSKSRVSSQRSPSKHFPGSTGGRSATMGCTLRRPWLWRMTAS